MMTNEEFEGRPIYRIGDSVTITATATFNLELPDTFADDEELEDFIKAQCQDRIADNLEIEVG